MIILSCIVFVHLFNDRSGSPKVLSQVVSAMAQHGADIEVLTSNYEDGFLNGLPGIRRNIFYRRSENKLFTLFYFLMAQIFLFVQCLSYWRRDVVFYVNTMMPCGAALAARLMGKQVIYHLHETSLRPALLKKILRLVIRMTASKIIFVSNYLCKVEGFSNIPQYVVHNALNLNASNDQEEYLLDINEFSQAPDISIDYAVMEKSSKVSVVSCDIGWSDIGSWDSLSELSSIDESGNRLDDADHTIIIDSKNNYIKSDANRVIAAVGVHDLIIVDTPDALLIANKNNAQDVKKVVAQLKDTKHESCQLHLKVSRPWGSYTTLEEGNGFKMKRICVKPGGSLSLQMHHHRSEHWIVVSGTAMVVNGDKETLLHANESTYIPAGQTHRLTNPGVIECVMIEVQVGVYLGEDDIVRFSDIYGRAN